jgi:hypothetical protein
MNDMNHTGATHLGWDGDEDHSEPHKGRGTQQINLQSVSVCTCVLVR